MDQSLLSNLPSPSSIPSELKASYIVPEGILRQLLTSSQRLDRILADPLQHLRDHVEKELRDTLDNASLSSEERSKRYAELLAAQAQMKDGGGPTEKSPTEDPLPDGVGLLSGVPTDQKAKAEQFLSQLRRYPDLFATNSRGNAVLAGQVIAGSNMSDMLGVLFRATPPGNKDDAAEYWADRLPHGTEQLLRALAESPIGSGLIRNQYLAGRVERLRRNEQRDSRVAQRQLTAIDSLDKQRDDSSSKPPVQPPTSLLSAYRVFRKRQKPSSASDRSIYS